MTVHRAASERLLRDSVLTVGALILSTAIGVVASALRSRSLGPSALGEYTAIVIVPATLMVVTTLGTNVSIIQLLGSSRVPAQAVRQALLVLVCVMSAVVIPLGNALFLDLDPRWLGGASVASARLGLSMFPAVLALSLLSAVLQGQGRIARFNVISLVGPTASLGVLAVASATKTLDLRTAIIAWGVVQVVGVTTAGWYVGWEHPVSWKATSSAIRQLLSAGLLPFVANVTGYLSRRVDVFLVARWAGPAALGTYAIAYTVGELVWYAASAAATALAPTIARADDVTRGDLTPRMCRLVIAVTIAASGVLLLAGQWLVVRVYGASFARSVPALQLLLPGILAAGVEKVLAGDLIGRGRTGITAASAVLAFGSNVALNAYLIPRFSANGAAFASSMSYILAAALTIILYCRSTAVPVRAVLVPRFGDVRVVMRAFARSADSRDV